MFILVTESTWSPVDKQRVVELIEAYDEDELVDIDEFDKTLEPDEHDMPVRPCHWLIFTVHINLIDNLEETFYLFNYRFTWSNSFV